MPDTVPFRYIHRTFLPIASQEEGSILVLSTHPSPLAALHVPFTEATQHRPAQAGLDQPSEGLPVAVLMPLRVRWTQVMSVI